MGRHTVKPSILCILSVDQARYVASLPVCACSRYSTAASMQKSNVYCSYSSDFKSQEEKCVLLHMKLLKNVDVWIRFDGTRDCRRCNDVSRGCTSDGPISIAGRSSYKASRPTLLPLNLLFFAYPLLFPRGKSAEEWSLCLVCRLKMLTAILPSNHVFVICRGAILLCLL